MTRTIFLALALVAAFVAAGSTRALPVGRRAITRSPGGTSEVAATRYLSPQPRVFPVAAKTPKESDGPDPRRAGEALDGLMITPELIGGPTACTGGDDTATVAAMAARYNASVNSSSLPLSVYFDRLCTTRSPPIWNAPLSNGSSLQTEGGIFGNGLGGLKYIGPAYTQFSGRLALASATITASIANNVLNVTVAAPRGVYVLGGNMPISGASVANGQTILNQISGTTGGVGTYQLSLPQANVASETMTIGYGLLTVVTMQNAGTVAANMFVGGVGVPRAAVVAQQLPGGTSGGAGNYQINTTPLASVPTENMTTGVAVLQYGGAGAAWGGGWNAVTRAGKVHDLLIDSNNRAMVGIYMPAPWNVTIERNNVKTWILTGILCGAADIVNQGTNCDLTRNWLERDGPSVGVAITNITRSTAAAFSTAAPHGMQVGDLFFVQGVQGMTQANGNANQSGAVEQVATVLSPTSFTTTTNSSSWSVYAGGGALYPLAKPYSSGIEYPPTYNGQSVGDSQIVNNMVSGAAWLVYAPSMWDSKFVHNHLYCFLTDGECDAMIVYGGDGSFTDNQMDGPFLYGYVFNGPRNDVTGMHVNYPVLGGVDGRASIVNLATANAAASLIGGSLKGAVDASGDQFRIGAEAIATGSGSLANYRSTGVQESLVVDRYPQITGIVASGMLTWNGTALSLASGEGVRSVTRHAAGRYGVTLNRRLPANAPIHLTPAARSGPVVCNENMSSRSADYFQAQCFNLSAAPTDPAGLSFSVGEP